MVYFDFGMELLVFGYLIFGVLVSLITFVKSRNWVKMSVLSPQFTTAKEIQKGTSIYLFSYKSKTKARVGDKETQN